MTKLERLMTRRARLQHRLDLLVARGDVCGERRQSRRELRAKIGVLTAQINTLRARDRSRERKSQPPARIPKNTGGKRGVPWRAPQDPAGQSPDGPRSARQRARQLYASSRRRFGTLGARGCARCRTRFPVAAARDEWSMIGEYHVPPSYYESTCVSFSTE